MYPILVTGSSGQLGREVSQLLNDRGMSVAAYSRCALDIANERMISCLFASRRFSAVINCAAYTSVDDAERYKDEAFQVNAKGPCLLALQCLKLRIPLVQISTDYVFGRNSGSWHNESENPKASCHYGYTKLQGEKLILQSGCNSIILRTSWLFGRYGNNFVKKIVNKAQNEQIIRVVSDEFGNPTPVSALAEAVFTVIKRIVKGGFDNFGIYHFAGSPAVDRVTFAKEILSIAYAKGYLKYLPKVAPISKRELGLPAVRPADSSLDTGKFERIFAMPMPKWQNFIEETIK